MSVDAILVKLVNGHKLTRPFCRPIGALKHQQLDLSSTPTLIIDQDFNEISGETAELGLRNTEIVNVPRLIMDSFFLLVL